MNFNASVNHDFNMYNITNDYIDRSAEDMDLDGVAKETSQTTSTTTAATTAANSTSTHSTSEETQARVQEMDYHSDSHLNSSDLTDSFSQLTLLDTWTQNQLTAIRNDAMAPVEKPGQSTKKLLDYETDELFDILLTIQHKLLEITKNVIEAPPLKVETLEQIEQIISNLHRKQKILIRELKHRGLL